MLNLLFFALLAFSGPLFTPVSAREVTPASAASPAATRLRFTAHDGLTLSYVRYEATTATPHPVVISVGCGESAYRYEALVGDLRERGYGPVFILEHRGQGYSDGTGVRADLVHVEHFEDYVTDFIDFMRGPVTLDLAARGITTPPDLIAHSMGGAIANLALRDHPDLVRKVAYVAPMMDINTSVLNPMNDRLALWAADVLCAVGFGERLGVGGLGRTRKLKTPGVPREIEEHIFRGGVTPGWLKEAIRATRRIRVQAPAHAEPSLIIIALRDRLVENKALRSYATRAQNTSLREIDGPHGLHHDARARGQLITAIDEFFGGCESRLEN